MFNSDHREKNSFDNLRRVSHSDSDTRSRTEESKIRKDNNQRLQVKHISVLEIGPTHAVMLGLSRVKTVSNQIKDRV